MALKIWLPLDGDLRNLGASNAIVTNSSATINTTGKIGSCYSFAKNAYLDINKETMQNFSNAVSICFWIKINSWNTNWDTFFQAGKGSTAWTQYHIGILRNSANYLCWTLGNGSTASNANYRTGNITLGEWTHVACTYGEGKWATYLNGILSNSGTTTIVPNFSNITSIKIGGLAGNYKCDCLLNDFRIYDHCLSAAEVHEIAMGLVLHYKLDLPNPNLAINTNTNNVSTNAWALSMQTGDKTNTIEIMDSIPVLIITRGSTERSGWLFLSYTNFSRSLIKINTTYTVSFDVWASNNGTINLTGLLNGNATNYMTNNTTNIQNTVIANQWNHILLQCTTKSSFEDITIGSQVIYMSPSGSLCGTGAVLKFKNMKLEEGNKETPWCPHSSDLLYTILGYNNVVEDCSGYGHNGTIINTITTSSDTPRYNNCLHMSATNQKVQINNLITSGFSNSYSFSWWGKCSTFSNTMQWGFSNGIRLNGIYNGTLWNTGDSSSNPLYKPGTTTQVTAPSTGIWHHFAMTGDGTNCKVYLDGEYWGIAKTYKSISGTSIYLNGWDNSTSYSNSDLSLSDFRIYCTPLLNNDIKMLYNVGMRMDNLGGVHSFEFDEINNNPKLFKTGIFKNQFFIEDGYEFNQGKGWSFTAAGTQNSCAGNVIADFSNIATLKQSITLQIECDVNWSNINVGTESGAGGWFQGSNRKLDGTWKWEGTNYAHPGTNLTSLFKANATGSTHIKVQRTIPASWFNTYNGSNISFRTDYTTGTITLSNLKITLVPEKFKINSVYVASNNFIEI